MTEFLSVVELHGFDSHRSPRWQMVPLNGCRYLALRNGVRSEVVSAVPEICHVAEIGYNDLPPGTAPPGTSHRLFCLSGLRKGPAIVRAHGRTPVDLEVDVKARRTIRVAFNFVRDSAKRRTCRTPADAAEWVKMVNSILLGQANLEFVCQSARWVRIRRNLGSVLRTATNSVGKEIFLYQLGDETADLNIFLVWAMDITDHPGDQDAFADGNRIVVEDNCGSEIGETIAHEICHSLGLDDQYTVPHELMYGTTDLRGVHLSKEHVNIINP